MGIEQTASQAVSTLSKVMLLKSEMESTLQADFGRRSRTALKLLHQLFVHPVVTIAQAQNISGLSKKAANGLVAVFVKEKILNEVTGQSRSRVFVFQK